MFAILLVAIAHIADNCMPQHFKTTIEWHNSTLTACEVALLYVMKADAG